MADVTLTVNGRRETVAADPGDRLLEVLRHDLGLTGSKYGCGEGQCGACTVLLEGRAVRSCVTRLDAVGTRQVVTIEGLAQADALHPVQEAFLEVEAFQCGYCTPGMIMATVALLRARPDPSPADISREARMSDPRDHIEPERYELSSGPSYLFRLQRRQFLQVTGGGLVVAALHGQAAGQGPDTPARPDALDTDDVAAWLQVDAAGRVTVFTGKVSSLWRRPSAARCAASDPWWTRYPSRWRDGRKRRAGSALSWRACSDDCCRQARSSPRSWPEVPCWSPP